MTYTLTGTGLSVAQLNRLSRSQDDLDIDDDGLNRVARAHATLNHAAEHGVVYGATTGVGANRSVSLDEAATGQAFLLWRSSATGVGHSVSPRVARAAMIVRLNQILAGGSGVSPAITRALAEAVRAERHPLLSDGGSIGTGDLSALGELALTLVGERPWADDTTTHAVPAEHDGLPFISSSAVTLAAAAAAVEAMGDLLESVATVSALSSLAMRGSVQPMLPPHEQHFAPAAQLFLSIAQAPQGAPDPAARVQDPFGLRALPQVHGAAAEALARARAVIEDGINGVHENPRVDGDAVIHNGRFHTARLGLAIDAVRSAILSVAALSSARTSKLMDPAITGLTPFLSDGAPGSSGLMMTEYLVEDAVAELRLLATPATGASVTISLGVEEHASFAPQSVRALQRMFGLVERISMLELISAHRALLLDPARVTTEAAARIVTVLGRTLSADIRDRPIGEDVRNGRLLLRSMTVRGAAGDLRE